MLSDWLLIAGGLALLVLGGEGLVRGASGIALLARITPTVVGLTVVAAGTSMPELVVSLQSALADHPTLAIGNVVGSNVFNIGAILALTAMLCPLRIQGNTVRFEWPIVVLAAFQLHLLARDGTIDRLEGGFLVGALVAFVGYSVLVARKQATTIERHEFARMSTASFGRSGGTAWLTNVVAVAVGVGTLAFGSTLLVDGAVGVAGALGMDDTVIGLTVVAAGTSAPELATSLVAARRGQADVAVANVLGSNVFNVLCIAGVTSLVHPLPVPPEIIARDNWWMLGFSVVLFPVMRSGMRITRAEGALLFAAFVVYMTTLIRSV